MNFIIINPDEMRHDAVRCYGNDAAVTPNIDQLASEGTKFENCFVQNPVCSPSRACFTTGLYPHNGGHRTLFNLLGSDDPNIFSYLKENGYDVHIWGKNDVLDPDALEKSATTVNYEIDMSKNVRKNAFEFKTPGYYSFLCESTLNTYKDFSDYRAIEGAIDYLDTKPEKPFCLFLPTALPHCPYRISKDFEGIIDTDKMPELKPYIKDGKPDFYKLIRDYRELDKVDTDVFKKIMETYLSMVAVSDKMTGDLLEAVKRNGFEEDTAIIFFSDHGDWAGDYGLVEKWPNALDDCLTHVPLIIKVPGMKQNNQSKAPVELFDIVATIMELAGIESKHTHFSQSLIPQLDGKEGDMERTVYAEGGYDTHEPSCFEGSTLKYDVPMNAEGIYYPKGLQQQEKPESVCRSVMARTLEFKLIRRTNGENELYDLNNDPMELTNLYNNPDYESVQKEFEYKLIDWYLRTSDTVPVERKARGFDKTVVKKLNTEFKNRSNTI